MSNLSSKEKPDMANIRQLVELLHSEQCSCVIWNEGKITTFHQRGVRDLYTLLCHTPEVLCGASIADKVIGKGAAALMILGKVKAVYADIISEPAMDLFKRTDIDLLYSRSVPNIINRTRTGICPVETLCVKCDTAEDCFPLIREFIENNNK